MWYFTMRSLPDLPVREISLASMDVPEGIICSNPTCMSIRRWTRWERSFCFAVESWDFANEATRIIANKITERRLIARSLHGRSIVAVAKSLFHSLIVPQKKANRRRKLVLWPVLDSYRD